MEYLFETKTGRYNYRRRVPDSLRSILGKREWKKSLKTTHKATALARYAQYSLEVEREIRAASRTLGNQTLKTSSRETFQEAVALAKSWGIHPDQMPTLPANFSSRDMDAFQAKAEEWRALMDQWLDIYPETGPDGYYREPDPDSVKAMVGRVVTGEVESSIVATWSEAVDQYFSINAQDKRRDPHTQQKFEIKTGNLFDRFISITNHNPRTKITSFTRQDARRFLDVLRGDGLSESSVGRYSSQIGAVFNLARVEYGTPELTNPFEGLRNAKNEEEDAQKRRSFTPQELNQYVMELRGLPNAVMGLIGLVMVYTGCRTGDAAGLCAGDVVLEGNNPHIKFRSNQLRKLNKKSLPRSVPIAPPLLDALRGHSAPSDPQEPMFGKYGPVKSHSNVSNQLGAVITDRMGVRDPALVPYSSRHTFKDRGRVARIRIEIIDYMQGHVTTASSKIAQGYGTGLPPEELIEDLEKLLQTKRWGDNM